MEPLKATPELPPADVRRHWEGLALTFLGIVFAVVTALVLFVAPVDSIRDRLAVAAGLTAAGYIVFGPAKRWTMSVSEGYLRRAPKGRARPKK